MMRKKRSWTLPSPFYQAIPQWLCLVSVLVAWRSPLQDSPARLTSALRYPSSPNNQWTWMQIQASESSSPSSSPGSSQSASELMRSRPSPPISSPPPPSRSLNLFRSTSPRLWPVKKSCCVFNLVGLSFPRTFLQHHIYIFHYPPYCPSSSHLHIQSILIRPLKALT